MNTLRRMLSLIILTLILSPVYSVYGYTSNLDITVVRGTVPSGAERSETVTIEITVTIGDIGSDPIRGFYLSDEINGKLTIDSSELLLDGSPVGNLTVEEGSIDDIYPGAFPFRWILETPPDFSENNPLYSGKELTLSYEITIPEDASLGTVYTFPGYNWVGRISSNPVEDIFGYEDFPEITLTVFAATTTTSSNTSSTTSTVPLTTSTTTIEQTTTTITLGSITATSPETGETWGIGYTKTISWTSSGVDGNVKIELGRISGCERNWSNIPYANNTGNDGIHPWTVQGPAQGNCIIRITSIDNPDIYGKSGLFNIAGTITASSTTTISLNHLVNISPSEVTLESGYSFQFNATTKFNNIKVDGTYNWELLSNNANIGSSINTTTGLYKAGENDIDFDTYETIKVTDIANDNITDTASVTIKHKTPPLPACSITINPKSVSLSSLETIRFTASTQGEVVECADPSYGWSIVSSIESNIDSLTGLYTAGFNDIESEATDSITAVDYANDHITAFSEIKVSAEEIQGTIVGVFPHALYSSNRLPILWFLIIFGDDTNFNSTSIISFVPDDTITPLFNMGFGSILFTPIIVEPGSQEEYVDIIVTIGEGEERFYTVGKKLLRILPLPSNLDENSLHPAVDPDP